MRTERQLGDLWIQGYRNAGAWALKIPASSTAGIPDWLILHGGLELWEAKRTWGSGPLAYHPKQLSAAQRFFQRMLKRYAPRGGGVVVLGETGFVELSPAAALGPLTRAAFLRKQITY